MPVQMRHMAVGAALLLLTACANGELGINTEGGDFGNATMNNTLIQSGQLDYAVALGGRFAAEVPTTVNFEFNSSTLDGAAQATLDQQANWIRQFPEVRFRVYGHADRVGSNGYNHALGLRRARAVVAYLGSRGISRSRLEAMVSYGETRPVVDTLGPEVRNRRTVTEVSGFVQNHPLILNGKYAAVVMRTYLTLAERPHPSNKTIVTQTNPGS